MSKPADRYATDAPLPPSEDRIQEPQAYWTLVPLLEDPHNHRQIIVTKNNTSKIKTLVVTPIAVTEYKHIINYQNPADEIFRKDYSLARQSVITPAPGTLGADILQQPGVPRTQTPTFQGQSIPEETYQLFGSRDQDSHLEQALQALGARPPPTITPPSAAEGDAIVPRRLRGRYSPCRRQ